MDSGETVSREEYNRRIKEREQAELEAVGEDDESEDEDDQ